MFNVGGMELLAIAIVALVVLGPDKLPGALRQLGSVIGEVRRISQGFQTDLRGALTEAEREAELARQSREPGASAAKAGIPQADPDPGAAMAAAQAELAAAEAAQSTDDEVSPSTDDDPSAA